MNYLQFFSFCVLFNIGYSTFQCPDTAYKWYVDPSNCKNYFICLNGNVLGSGHCEGVTNWWQSMNSCNFYFDPSPGAECTPGELVTPPPTTPANTEVPETLAPCNHQAVVGDNSKFFDISAPEIIKSCPSNLIFDASAEACTCVLPDGSNLPSCNLIEALLLKFEENILDSGCNGGSVFNTGSENLNFTSNGKSGFGGKFTSDNKLDYNGWNNKFNGFNGFASLAFDISSSSKSQDEVVMQYGQCIGSSDNSIKIILKANLAIEVKIENNLGTQVSLVSSSLSANQYFSIAFVFDGVNAILYVNGAEAMTSELDGGVKNLMCALEIGKGLNADLDNVRVFNQALSASEVAAL